jgi:uncharacterized phage protein gp47/JayE
MLAELLVAIPDAYTGEDGVIRIVYEIEAGQFENLYLATQLLLEDMFVSTASYSALIRHGEQYGLPMMPGVYATGTLKFSGAGGTYIAIGTECAYNPGGGLDPIFYETTIDGTLPDPGVPDAPTVAVGAATGLTGAYEYGVSFVTASGETLVSPDLAPISVTNQKVDISAIPIGGPGVTKRRIYRDKNGAGNFRLVTEIADNTTTTFTDDIADATVDANPAAPTIDTASQMTLAARAQEVGVLGNTIVGTVTEITSADVGITDVTNPTAFTGGEDQEDSEEYRQRLLAFIRNPQTGSPSDLKAWAENVPGVETATVFENEPVDGTVTVRISGPGGTVPPTEVVTATQEALDALDYANITIIVDTIIVVAANVTVEVLPMDGFDLEEMTPTIQAAISNYAAGLGAGESMRLSGIIDAVFGLSGVQDVIVTLPTTNQDTATPDQKLIAGVVTVDPWTP